MTHDTETAETKTPTNAVTHKPPPPASSVANPECDTVIFFDVPVLAYGYSSGLGSATLAARRQIVDASGAVREDLVITALLRAPMHALRQLRDCIDGIERLEAQHAAAAVAMLERPAGPVQ